MAVRRPVRKKSGGGIGLLLCVLLIVGLFALKYADTPFARTAREKVTAVFGETLGLDRVLTAIGGGDDGVSEVFSPQTGTASESQPMLADGEYAASSGGADEMCIRDRLNVLWNADNDEVPSIPPDAAERGVRTAVEALRILIREDAAAK